MRVDRAVEAVAEQRAEIVREAVGIDALALYQAGVAEGGLLRRAAPVDEQRSAPALLQVDRDRDADDAGAEDDCICASQLVERRNNRRVSS